MTVFIRIASPILIIISLGYILCKISEEHDKELLNNLKADKVILRLPKAYMVVGAFVAERDRIRMDYICVFVFHIAWLCHYPQNKDMENRTIQKRRLFYRSGFATKNILYILQRLHSLSHLCKQPAIGNSKKTVSY